MDDLISRQAAIDALDEQIEQCDKALSSFDISIKDGFAVKVERASLVAFRETLEYLPPAQPAPSQVEADIARIVENGKDMRVIEAAQPTPDQNGDLWITVPDIDKVTCIYVQESKSKFCRIFYEER